MKHLVLFNINICSAYGIRYEVALIPHTSWREAIKNQQEKQKEERKEKKEKPFI